MCLLLFRGKPPVQEISRIVTVATFRYNKLKRLIVKFFTTLLCSFGQKHFPSERINDIVNSRNYWVIRNAGLTYYRYT